MHQMRHDTLARRLIHSGDIIDWEFLVSQGLDQAFFESINNNPFSSPNGYDPEHSGVRFRLGASKGIL
ncbi:hypothetical protein Tco_0946557 [Tanacetum coccineum]